MQLRFIIILFLIFSKAGLAQQDSLSYPEFLDKIINQHPVVKWIFW